jgi:hypothetical protein
MKRVIPTLALLLLTLAPAIAQTPDGASKTPEGEKPTPQVTDEDKAEKQSVKKAPDQTEVPAGGTKPPSPSSATKEAK